MSRPRKTRNPRGAGTVYEKRPGQWVVSWREGKRRFTSKAVPTRELAEKARARLAHDRALEIAGLPPDETSIPSFGYLGDEWIARHKTLLRSSGDDASRWRCHVLPWFGRLRPAQVDHAEIRRFVEAKVKTLDPATVGHCVKLLSRIFGDLIERPRETGVSVNPVRSLPRSVRRLYRPKHDPKATPFLESLETVEVLASHLAEPFRTMYVVGVYAMLRPGEILGVFAEDVDLFGRRIQVHRQVQFGKIGPLKDDEARTVPIPDVLAPRLAAQLERVGKTGPLFPTTRRNGGGRRRAPSRFISIHTLHDRFSEACTKAHRPDIQEWAMPWYQSTRHTGASHWVMKGGDMGRLASILGHSTTWVSERYAHVVPGLFSAADLGRFGSPTAPKASRESGRKRQKRKS